MNLAILDIGGEHPDVIRVNGEDYVRVKAEPTPPKDPTEGHQPTPWEFDEDYTQLDSNGEIVVYYDDFGLAAANRAFDLRAVNNHYDLVKFVKRVGKCEDSNDCYESLASAARELLAQVKKS